MSRRCKICASDHLAEIDAAIVGHVGYRRIATRHGISEAAVRRHAAKHVPATLAASAAAKERVRGDNLLLQITDLHERTLRLLSNAEQDDQRTVALRAVSEARSNLALLGELVGELHREQDIAVGVQVNAVTAASLDEKRVRQAVLDLLVALITDMPADLKAQVFNWGDLKEQIVNWAQREHEERRHQKIREAEARANKFLPPGRRFGDTPVAP